MTVNADSLFLVMQNEGSHYARRCAAARKSATIAAAEFASIACDAARKMRLQFGEIYSAGDILRAAAMLADYHAEHAAELDR